MKSKAERLAEVLQRLSQATPPTSAEGARATLELVLAQVEDEFCEHPEDRMGPPLDDNKRSVSGWPDVARYRNKGHNTFIRANGAIRIEELPDNTVVLDLPGSNGKKVFDP